MSRPHLISGCLRRKRPRTAPVENSLLPPVDMNNYCSISQASFGRTEAEPNPEADPGREEEEEEEPVVVMCCEVKELSNGRPHVAMPTPKGLNNKPSRYRNRQSREKKATQMLAIVLGEKRQRPRSGHPGYCSRVPR